MSCRYQVNNTVDVMLPHELHCSVSFERKPGCSAVLRVVLPTRRVSSALHVSRSSSSHTCEKMPVQLRVIGALHATVLRRASEYLGTSPAYSLWSERLVSSAVCSSASTDSGPWVSEELLSKLSDRSILKTRGFVGGEWIEANDGSTFEVLNPSTGKLLARIANLKARETSAAIVEASNAFPDWSAKTGKERSKVLRKWHDAVVEATEDIATIMTAECGKPLAESKAEILQGAGSIDWFAEEGRRVYGDLLPTTSSSLRMVTMKQAVGVVAAITPWNFPCSMITRKVSPAIAAGCTVVLKPAEATPLTALALAELADRSGIPRGVLNIVAGDAPAIGKQMLESDTVRKIGFTGSTRIGKQLMAGAAETVKRVSLELGGNAPFIVFDDADVEMAAAGVVASAFRNAGQTCICANRIFVQDGVYEEFTSAVADLARKFRLGDGLLPATTLGPLISPAAVDRVEAHVEDAKAKGGNILAGGGRPKLEGDAAGGFFFEPTVIGNASIDMRIYKEETFGPAIPCFRFQHDAEAVKMANDTEYGLAAYFYTKDLARAWKAAEQVEYGMIGINETGIGSEVAPFGGLKHSGLGKELSKYGIEEFLSIKYCCFNVGYNKSL